MRKINIFKDLEIEVTHESNINTYEEFEELFEKTFTERYYLPKIEFYIHNEAFEGGVIDIEIKVEELDGHPNLYIDGDEIDVEYNDNNYAKALYKAIIMGII